MQSRAIDSQELANLLSVRRQTVIAWAKRGRIPALHAGHHTFRFILNDVLAALSRPAAQPVPSAVAGTCRRN